MIRQDYSYRNCGQCCLATILNISLEEAIKLVGHNHGTQSRELTKHIKCSKNKRGYPSKYSLCISRPNGITKGNWHWVIFKDNKIYCPSIGDYINEEYYDFKISSYFEIYN